MAVDGIFGPNGVAEQADAVRFHVPRVVRPVPEPSETSSQTNGIAPMCRLTRPSKERSASRTERCAVFPTPQLDT